MKARILIFLFVSSALIVRTPLASEPAPVLEIFPAVELQFQSSAGARYQVQVATNLTSENWQDFGDPLTGTGQPLTLFAPARHNAKQFFRLVKHSTGFVLIPAGAFLMGSPPDEPGRYLSETQHPVTITRGFYLQTTEVTWAQWNMIRDWAVMHGYVDLSPGQSGNFGTANASEPVTRVSWYDAVKWLNAWSEMDGRTPCYNVGGTVYRTGENDSIACDWNAPGYRLPTEAEWEYACRAGTTTAFYTGPITPGASIDPNLDPAGWYRDNSSGYTHSVGLKQANAWGLFDMHGNVWEWCWDWHVVQHDSAPATDPRGPSSGSARMSRGGSFSRIAGLCRSAAPGGLSPELRRDQDGFRPARSSAP